MTRTHPLLLIGHPGGVLEAMGCVTICSTNVGSKGVTHRNTVAAFYSDNPQRFVNMLR